MSFFLSILSPFFFFYSYYGRGDVNDSFPNLYVWQKEGRRNTFSFLFPKFNRTATGMKFLATAGVQD